MRYLLDTNAVIALLKDAASQLARRVRAYEPAEFGLSAVVLHELAYGAHKSEREKDNLERVAAIRFECVPFDREDAMAAGLVRARLAKRGTPIGPFDVQLAGQAMSRGLILVTANVREFNRVEGLKVEDWSGD